MAEKPPKPTAPKKAISQTKASGTTTVKVAPKKPPVKAPAKSTIMERSPAKPAVVAKVPTAKKPAPKASVDKKHISNELRYRMIAEAAYFRAERCHFKSDPVRDWIEAERDIALLLGKN